MATLWIREYADVGRISGVAELPMAQEPGVDQTPVTFTTSVASAAFGLTTRYIGIIASAAFHYVVAAAPVATTGALKVPADTLVFVGVPAGQKIAAIAAV